MFKCYTLSITASNKEKTMTTVTSMKCACESCLCIVSLENALQKNGKYYCCEACADGHVNEKGCGHTGCTCG
ncbi:Prokaryotic metallothionein [Pleurocapsa sp. PCC 7327]|nr:Prokaryotic metallothionein [Pleurocapsa sp. PCC 7327]